MQMFQIILLFTLNTTDFSSEIFLGPLDSLVETLIMTSGIPSQWH